MNWISNVVPPRVRSFLNKRESAESLWIKCPQSGEMVFHRDLEQNQYVVPNSGYHMRIGGHDRLRHFFDDGKFSELPTPRTPTDPLKFRDQRRYADKLKEAKSKTGLDDSIILARGKIGRAHV